MAIIKYAAIYNKKQRLVAEYPTPEKQFQDISKDIIAAVKIGSSPREFSFPTKTKNHELYYIIRRKLLFLVIVHMEEVSSVTFVFRLPCRNAGNTISDNIYFVNHYEYLIQST